MNKKTILILLTIFVIVLGIAAAPWWLPLFQQKAVSQPEGFNFAQYSELSVNSFEIKKGSDVKSFSLTGDKWKIGDANTNEELVKEFIKSLSQISVKELVSKNPENHADLEITDETGFLLKINGKEEYVIGKNAPGWTGFYIRKKDAPEVYLAEGGLNSFLNYPLEQWQEKAKEEGAEEDGKK